MRNEIRFFIEDHPKAVRIVTIALVAIVVLLVALLSRSCSNTETEEGVRIVFDSGETEPIAETESEQSFLKKVNGIFENREYSEETKTPADDGAALFVFDDETMSAEASVPEERTDENETVAEYSVSQDTAQSTKPILIDQIKYLTIKSFLEYVNTPKVERIIVIMIFLAVFIYAFLIDIIYIILSGFKVGLEKVERGMKKIEKKKSDQVDEPVLDLDQEILEEKRSQYREIDDDSGY